MIPQSNDAETVGEDVLWSNTLFRAQKDQANLMRETLMECDKTNPLSVRITLQNIKAQRIYHQVIRIIRYTEEMDKIENKLYQTIDKVLDEIDILNNEDSSFASLRVLLELQEKLQKSMIDSHKLLDPYLNVKELTYIEVPVIATAESENDMIAGKVIDQDSRKRLREGAQEVLDTLTSVEA